MDNAPTMYARKVLARMYRGEVVQVDEYADLGALDKTIRQGRLLAINKGAPAKIVDNLSRYLDELDRVKQQVAATQMPQGSAGAPAPAVSTAASQGLPMPFAGGRG
jgi:hypothetical protein